MPPFITHRTDAACKYTAFDVQYHDSLDAAVSFMRGTLEEAGALYRDVDSHATQAAEWLGPLENVEYWAEMPDGGRIHMYLDDDAEAMAAYAEAFNRDEA